MKRKKLLNIPHPHIPHPHIPHPHIPHPHIPVPHGFLPNIIDQYIHSKWGHYIFQCGLATLSLILILVIGDSLLRAAIVVGIASSTFTVFVIPHSVAASPRRVLGGHLVAATIGSTISLILHLTIFGAYAEDTKYLLDICAAISVGIGILLMVVTNTEHPPAAGTALGLVIYGFDWSSVVFILASALLLCLVRWILFPKMINLL